MPAPERGSSAWREATLTMRPPFFFMALTAARQHRKQDMRLLSICAISAALSVSATVAGGETAGDMDRGP